MTDIKDRIGDRIVIASVSGGKDSAAMCLWLQEQSIEHVRVFADTGWEAAETYEYLRGPLTEKLGPIHEVGYPGGMEALCRKKSGFPPRTHRWCTSELKVKPILAFIEELCLRADSEDAEPIQTVGIRAGESVARSRLTEWEWSDAFDCDVWRPLIAWSEQDVIDIHTRHGLAPNPLYLRGASRVGCWPCIFARKAEIENIADVDPGQIGRIEALEAELTERAGEQRSFFHRDGLINIADVVRWSRTARGGRQYELFAPETEPGCVRWGLCESTSGGDNDKDDAAE